MRRPPILATAITLIVSLVGLVDAGKGRIWDLFVLFLAVALVQAVVLLSVLGSRVPVSLRPDLARWVTQRSQRTGEPIDDVIDRSVAGFQMGLHGPSRRDDA